jgi:CheY-like chemotaxis protein
MTARPAASEAEALELLTGPGREVWDLMVVDLYLPDGSGLRLAEAVGLMEGLKPDVILTANEDLSRLAARVGELEVSRVLSKPLFPRSLAEAAGLALGLGDWPDMRAAWSGEDKKGEEVMSEVRGARILLAEDNEINQLVVTKLLKKVGVEVEIVGNGRLAVERVKEIDYDLVLMDIQMPEMDGLTASRTIRRLPGYEDEPVIVAMTAHAMSGDREQSLAVGMNDHITKPINLAELFGALSRWIVKDPAA